MKYIFALIALSACGAWAIGMPEETANAAVIVDIPAVETGKSGGKNLARRNGDAERSYRQPSYTQTIPPRDALRAAKSPIPALILPNNVCIINTDLAPDRSIEDHILACMHAQRIRQSIPR